MAGNAPHKLRYLANEGVVMRGSNFASIDMLSEYVKFIQDQPVTRAYHHCCSSYKPVFHEVKCSRIPSSPTRASEIHVGNFYSGSTYIPFTFLVRSPVHYGTMVPSSLSREDCTRMLLLRGLSFDSL